MHAAAAPGRASPLAGVHPADQNEQGGWAHPYQFKRASSTSSRGRRAAFFWQVEVAGRAAEREFTYRPPGGRPSPWRSCAPRRSAAVARSGCRWSKTSRVCAREFTVDGEGGARGRQRFEGPHGRGPRSTPATHRDHEGGGRKSCPRDGGYQFVREARKSAPGVRVILPVKLGAGRIEKGGGGDRFLPSLSASNSSRSLVEETRAAPRPRVCELLV